jgi:RNA polymerase sigma-70 factor, ECF subfamily
VSRHDPFADTETLIRRVYAYVAYRLGDGPQAEDVTSDVFERALRYRASFDESRGEPLAWLIGIARRSVETARAACRPKVLETTGAPAPGDLEADTLLRLQVRDAVAELDDRDRELVALRYGADLSAKQIAVLLGIESNAVDVALHRVRARLRARLEPDESQPRAPDATEVEGLAG